MTAESGSETIYIRTMRLEDVEEVHQIDELSFSLPWSERSFRFELTENPSSMLWVAETSGLGETQRVVAMIVIWIIIDEAHIGSIAVHPDYRRRGIGRRILLQALIEAGKKGATMATLEVRRSNLPAQAMYRQLGFSGVGVRPRYYRDNGEDALLMTLQELDPVKLQSVLETLGND